MLKKIIGFVAFLSIILLLSMVAYQNMTPQQKSMLPKNIFPKNTDTKKTEQTLPDKNINKTLTIQLDKYFNEITAYTGIKLMPSQIALIKNYISKNPIYFLPADVRKQHRAEFDSIRKNLLTQWEKNAGVTWPQYTDNIYSDNKLQRKTGQNYDAHHIIELSWNGPNEWWNLTPAMFPSQHQNGIHAKGSIASKLFDIYGED